MEPLIARLEKVGFIFSRRDQQVELLRMAITTYKSIYNDLNIPKVYHIIWLSIWYHIILYCIVLYCIVFYSIVLYCIVL